MRPGELLLSFEGRIGPAAFLAGLVAIAVVVAATGLIFRVGEGAYCRMRWDEPLGKVWFVALFTMGAIVATMLLALTWKRAADMGLWRVFALAPVVFAAALPVLWRLEALGPCGAPTAERVRASLVAGAGLAGSLSLYLLPARRRRADQEETPAAGPAAQPFNE